jgi:hypothetical protein
MPQFYGVKELNSLRDWEGIIPTKHWVPTRSAYELAHHWFGRDGFPARVAAVLQPAFPRLIPSYGMVELPVFLDTAKAPSRTDIMFYCHTQGGNTVVVGVEGKSTEPFDDPVAIWVRDGQHTPTLSRTRRLQFLSKLLGVSISPDASFGYQLVHRTASVISECLLRGATSGIVVVHSFSNAASKNWSDFQLFTSTLGVSDIQKDTLAGPIQLGPTHDLDMFFSWIRDSPIQA